MRQIIDYIQFNTEIDLLEYHLNSLDHVIDYFIVVESEYTFTGKKKPLHLDLNIKRFKKFEHKLIYVNHTQVPHKNIVTTGGQWENEISQRNSGLLLGLQRLEERGITLDENDLVAISDCDEILDPRSLQTIKNDNSFLSQLLTLEMDFYYYDFRKKIQEKWYHAQLAPLSLIKSGKTAHEIRHTRGGQVIHKGGWHLSYFGGVDSIQKKLDDFSHQEFNNETFRNTKNITSAIANGFSLFDLDKKEFETNDFSYMPPDWRNLKIGDESPLPNLRIREQIYGNHLIYENFSPVQNDLQGWASYSQAFETVIAEIKPKLIIEVGTWKGASAINMARLCQKYCKEFEIICVDTFLGSFENWLDKKSDLISKILRHGRPNLYEIFLSNVVSEQLQDFITPLPMDSTNAALTLESLGIQADLIYIDATHSYESVLKDLLLFKQLVRPGGYLLGDDWFHPPIKRAVEEALGKVITLSPDKYLWRRS